MALRDNLSLRGMKDYAISKKGIPATDWTYKDLRDLENLINKMDAIRDGSSTEGCSSHGSEVGYGESKTNCSSHSFNYSPRSLGQVRDAIDMLQPCACDSFQKMYCDCHDNAVWCNCNSQY